MSEPRGPGAPLAAVEPSSADAVLRLARSDRAGALAQLRDLSPAVLAGLCQDLRPELRSEFLMLTDQPEQVVPLLDPTALAITVRSGGMSEGAWLLELASSEQRCACVDLDVWSGSELEPERVVEWLDALIEAGRPTLVQAVQELDPELWLLAVARMGELVVVGRDDEPPTGFATEDGQVYYRGHSDADFARLREILQTSFSEAQPYYWNLVYGTVFELPTELEEYALRWRTGRLLDLGFPEFEQAMRVYRPLAAEDADTLDLADFGPRAGAALVRTSELPRRLRGSLVGEALLELPPEQAGEVLGYVLSVANAIAVADRLRLTEPESVPRALRKAIAGIDRGLRELAGTRGQAPAQILQNTRPQDLFRIGATLDPDLRKS